MKRVSLALRRKECRQIFVKHWVYSKIFVSERCKKKGTSDCICLLLISFTIIQQLFKSSNRDRVSTRSLFEEVRTTDTPVQQPLLQPSTIMLSSQKPKRPLVGALEHPQDITDWLRTGLIFGLEHVTLLRLTIIYNTDSSDHSTSVHCFQTKRFHSNCPCLSISY